jgi:biopolymer transport protein ExbB
MESFVAFYQEGGFYMHPIALCALVGAAVMVERFIFLGLRFDIDGRRFYGQIQKLVLANDIDRAIKLCVVAERAALARVIKSGLTRADRSMVDVAAAVGEARLEVGPVIFRRISLIAAIANIATLCGLLGTIVGMTESFGCMMTVDAVARSQALAKQLAIAINTTGLGLIVAVPLLAAQVVLQSLARKISGEVDLYAAKLENLLAARAHVG